MISDDFSTFFVDIIKKSDEICLREYGIRICEKNKIPRYVLEMIVSLLEESWQHFESISTLLAQKYIPFTSSLTNLLAQSINSMYSSFSFVGMKKGVEELYYYRNFVGKIYMLAKETREEYYAFMGDESRMEIIRIEAIERLLQMS